VHHRVDLLPEFQFLVNQIFLLLQALHAVALLLGSIQQTRHHAVFGWLQLFRPFNFAVETPTNLSLSLYKLDLFRISGPWLGILIFTLVVQDAAPNAVAVLGIVVVVLAAQARLASPRVARRVVVDGDACLVAVAKHFADVAQWPNFEVLFVRVARTVLEIAHHVQESDVFGPAKLLVEIVILVVAHLRIVLVVLLEEVVFAPGQADIGVGGVPVAEWLWADSSSLSSSAAMQTETIVGLGSPSVLTVHVELVLVQLVLDVGSQLLRKHIPVCSSHFHIISWPWLLKDIINGVVVEATATVAPA
jgi:hypothetical protein